MTRQEFIEAYSNGTGQTWLQLQAMLSAVPCACGAKLCQGWRVVARPHSLDEPPLDADEDDETGNVLVQVHAGTSVTMTAAEVDALAGDGPVKLITGENGRIIGGIGQVGFIEHFGDTDLEQLVAAVKEKREALRTKAANPSDKLRENLFTFTKI